MIIREVQLETVCGITSRLPENTLAEVAFAGKSNVGKSSLINALIDRKSLARTSSSPGKTQTINFYRVKASSMTAAQREAARLRARAEHVSGEEAKKEEAKKEAKRGPAQAELYFVDLPGYGYAKASRETKAQWGKLIERYLSGSKRLKAVFLLVDIRHAPGANDIQMYDWIRRSGYQPVIVATKLDKINRSQQQKQLKLIRQTLKAAPGSVLIPFSAQTRQGREEIWERILELTGQGEMPPEGMTQDLEGEL